MSIMNAKQARRLILSRVRDRGPIGSSDRSFLNDFFQGHPPTSEQREIACKAVDSLEREQKVYVTYNDGGGISIVDVYDCAKAESVVSPPVVDLDIQDGDTMDFEEAELDPAPGMPELVSLVHQELLNRVDREGKIYVNEYDVFIQDVANHLPVRTSTKDVNIALLYVYKLGLRENLKGRRKYSRVRPLGITQQMIDCADHVGRTPTFEISMEDAQATVQAGSSEEVAIRKNIQNTHTIEQLQAELAAERQKSVELIRLQQENADNLVQNQELTDENQRLRAVLDTLRSAIDMELER